MKTLSPEATVRVVKLLTVISTVTAVAACMAILFAPPPYMLVAITVAFVALSTLVVAEFEFVKPRGDLPPSFVYKKARPAWFSWMAVVIALIYKVCLRSS